MDGMIVMQYYARGVLIPLTRRQSAWPENSLRKELGYLYLLIIWLWWY